MSLLTRFLKALRPATPKPPPPRVAGVFAPPYPAAGWWHDDPAEQLRNYRSWVYAAVNAIAQEAARHRPFLYLNTGQAEHEQIAAAAHAPALPPARPPQPVADAVGTLVSHDRLSGTDRQLRSGTSRRNRSATRGTACPAKSGSCRRRGCASSPIAAQYVKALSRSPSPACRPRSFGPDEVIHLKYPNPLDPHYGLSPLQANALTVDANTELLKSRYQTFLAGQRPGVVLQTEQTLTDHDGDAARREDSVGEVRRPGQLAPAAGAGTGAEGQPVDADARRDGLPQFVADDAATRSSRSSACRRRSPASSRTWAWAPTSGSAPA